MRIAIFSDVHGNLTALEAVLADIRQQAPDLIIFAGDLCLMGARPQACVDRLRQETIASVYGNTDEALSNRPLLARDSRAEERERSQEIDDNIDWTWSQMSEANRAWLRTLPFHRRVSPTPNVNDDLFIVHANPKDVHQHIYPPEAKQKEIFGEVRQADDDTELQHLLQDMIGGVLAFGHLHIPNIRHVDHKVLANISSVSLPRDGDPRAKYGLLEWNDEWHIEHRHVEYDIQAEVEQLGRLRPPKWRDIVDELENPKPH